MFKFVLILLVVLALVTCGCTNNQESVAVNQGKPDASPAAKFANRFIVAGSGTNLPITEQLAVAYRKKTGSKIEVPKSIGSDGAVKAVQDGTISLGLVSRPLTNAEQAAGLKTIQYARVGIVFAVHPSVREDNVTFEEILQMHRAQKSVWADGTRIKVLIRNVHDSSNQILFSMIPGFRRVIEESLAENRWPIMYHDVEMSDSLRAKAGTFGHTDTTSIKIFGGIKALSLNGIEPTPENVRSGRYPWVKELSFLYKGELSDQAKRFVEYVLSSEGRTIVEANGGVGTR